MRTSLDLQTSLATSTPKGGLKTSLLEVSKRNGRVAAHLQKTKNGKVTKDEWRKTAMDPEVLHFFRDELEKMAFSPGFAARHYGAKGIKGGIARGYSNLFGGAGLLDPKKVQSITQAAQNPSTLAFGPEFAAATAKGMLKAEGAKALVPAIRRNPRIADAATFYEQNIPSHLFGSKYTNLVDKVPGALRTTFGL